MSIRKFCDYCGTELKENADFCGYCGKQIESVENNVSTNESYYQQQQPAQQFNSAPAEPAYTTPPAYTAPPRVDIPPVAPPPKKSNKGVIAAIIVGVLIILAAIGYTAEYILNNSDSESDNSNEKTEVTQTPVEEPEETDEPTQKPTEKPKKTTVYEKGTFDDTTYKSDFIGVKYTAPSGWTISSQSDLDSLIEEEDDVTTYELHTQESTTGSNVILAVEKLPYSSLSTDFYLSNLKTNFENSADLDVTDITETGTTKIAGEDYETLKIVSNVNNVSLTQYLYVRKVEGYMVVFTLTQSPYAEASTDILDSFKKY